MSAVFRRPEFAGAALDLGSLAIDLADYATTGLRAVAVGPSGIGKTNAGLLLAEQLADQGWVSVLLDPEGEIEDLYGAPVSDADGLEARLMHREELPSRILVASARTATEFVPYGRAIMRAADAVRQPIFVLLDEAQLFSASRRRKDDVGEASDLVNDWVQRGRKRALDVCVTAHRFSGSLHRSVFTNANLTLIGRQDDPSAWSALAPRFRGTGLTFTDLAALGPGEFFALTRRGIEKVVMSMAAALAKAAPAATVVPSSVPATFAQWDRALAGITPARLEALTPDVTALLGDLAGLTTAQLQAGYQALTDAAEAAR